MSTRNPLPTLLEDDVCTLPEPRFCVPLRRRTATFVLDTSHSGGDIDEAIPDPIPNSEVKLVGADGTARVILWESRTLPGLSCWTRHPSRESVGGFSAFVHAPSSLLAPVARGCFVEVVAGQTESRGWKPGRSLPAARPTKQTGPRKSDLVGES